MPLNNEAVVMPIPTETGSATANPHCGNALRLLAQELLAAILVWNCTDLQILRVLARYLGLRAMASAITVRALAGGRFHHVVERLAHISRRPQLQPAAR